MVMTVPFTINDENYLANKYTMYGAKYITDGVQATKNKTIAKRGARAAVLLHSPSIVAFIEKETQS